MIGYSVSRRMVAAIALVLSLLCASRQAGAAPTTVVRTNHVDRWLTNVIDIQFPNYRFVNVYHTNRFDIFHTNVVQVFITNNLPLELVYTNLVSAYETNWRILKLTNFTTVVAFRTNWYNHTVTNFVDISMAPNQSVIFQQTPATPAKPAPPPASTPTLLDTEPLRVEAARTTLPGKANQFEVVLRLKSAADSRGFEIDQWRVESDDRTLLLFGQDPEFRRELPAGKYRVEVKARRAANSPLLTTRVWLNVGPREATVTADPLARL